MLQGVCVSKLLIVQGVVDVELLSVATPPQVTLRGVVGMELLFMTMTFQVTLQGVGAMIHEAAFCGNTTLSDVAGGFVL